MNDDQAHAMDADEIQRFGRDAQGRKRLKSAELTARLGIGRNTLHQWVKKGLVPPPIAHGVYTQEAFEAAARLASDPTRRRGLIHGEAREADRIARLIEGGELSEPLREAITLAGAFRVVAAAQAGTGDAAALKKAALELRGALDKIITDTD